MASTPDCQTRRHGAAWASWPVGVGVGGKYNLHGNAKGKGNPSRVKGNERLVFHGFLLRFANQTFTKLFLYGTGFPTIPFDKQEVLQSLA